MLFSSIPFLYYFLPCVLILYTIVPNRLKNLALLLVSLVFYAWGEPKYVFLMIAMILLCYPTGRLIQTYEGCKKGRAVLWGTTGICLGTLAFFKFSDVAWPIGISFYTFQLISYLVDVSRGTPAQKSLVNLGAYVTMFPQLIAGPIVRYGDIQRQLKERVCSYEKTLDGIFRFLIGLGKKILISNALGELCEIFQSSDDQAVLYFWLYAVSYTLQIYFDFSGYSDMAIGLGKLFGFEFMENFNYPYISKSITEFWRRWHISLGSWFRDYVYIPLGGNRVSRPRWYLNLLVVWFLTGLWHGAAWNFIVWGLMFAVLLVLEKQWKLTFGMKTEQKKESVVQSVLKHGYVLFFVILSFVIFHASNLEEAMFYLRAMFGAGGFPMVSQECIYYLKSYGVLLTAAMIGATPLPKRLAEKAVHTKVGNYGWRVLRPVAAILIFGICTAYLVDSSFNPFLYFRF